MRGEGGENDAAWRLGHYGVDIFKYRGLGGRESRLVDARGVHGKEEHVSFFKHFILLDFLLYRHAVLVFYPDIAGVDDVAVRSLDDNAGRVGD